MATNVQNAKAIIDALRDYRGLAVSTNQQAESLVERFTGQIGNDQLTGEEKADQFLFKLFERMLIKVKENSRRSKTNDYAVEIEAAAQAAEDELSV